MTAKEYLMQLEKIDKVINQKLQELDDLKEMSTAIGSFDYAKDKVQTSLSGDAPYVKDINKMIDLEQEINQDIDRFVDNKHMVIQQIQKLKDARYIDLLYKRYVEYKTFSQIAEEMDYTYQYIIELHGGALQEFERTYTNLYDFMLI